MENTTLHETALQSAASVRSLKIRAGSVRAQALDVARTEMQRKNESYLLCYTYICNDGLFFSAIAARERGAFCVLNAERRGMEAHLVRTSCVHPI